MHLMRDTTIALGGLFGCCRETLDAMDRDGEARDGDTITCRCGTPVVLHDRVWRWQRDA
jgi:hypothetical protein